MRDRDICDTTVPPPSVEDIKLTIYLSANRGRPEEKDRLLRQAPNRYFSIRQYPTTYPKLRVDGEKSTVEKNRLKS